MSRLFLICSLVLAIIGSARAQTPITIPNLPASTQPLAPGDLFIVDQIKSLNPLAHQTRQTSFGQMISAFFANLSLIPNEPVIGTSGGIGSGSKLGNTNTFATTTGTFINGNCRSTDSNFNEIDAGGPCTIGGGGGTVAAGVAGQFAYYNVNGNTVVGTAAPVNPGTAGQYAVYASTGSVLSGTNSLGTPSSITLTNGIGLPIDTGTTGQLPVSRINGIIGTLPCLTMEQFGGGISASAATNAAVLNFIGSETSSNANLCVTFLPGVYSMGPVTISFVQSISSISMFGQGPRVTVLDFDSGGGNGIVFNYNSPNQTVHMYGMTIETTNVNVGVGVYLVNSNPQSSIGYNDFVDMDFAGTSFGGSNYWQYGLLVNGVSFVNVDRCYFVGGNSGGYQGYGAYVEANGAGSFQYGIVYNFDQDLFLSINVGLYMGNWIQGVFVTNSNFTNGNVGTQIGGTSGQLDQMFMVNNQFGNEQSAGVLYTTNDIAASAFISDYFILHGPAAGIECSGICGHGQIVGSTFEADTLHQGVGIIFNTTAPGFTVVGNTFQNMNIGVDCGANMNIQSNSYSGLLANTSPASTSGSCIIGGGSS